MVSDLRILAVKAEPPEALPGDPTTYTALVAGPDGAVPNPAVNWGFCNERKPLTENNVVSAVCLDGRMIQAVGEGPSVTAPLPSQACLLFGPDTPPPAQGEPPLRPRDPDVTGGYYQPVAVAFQTRAAFALERIRCNLANAPSEAVGFYDAHYTNNRNPALQVMTPAAGSTVPSGSRVRLLAQWTTESAERYPVFNLETQRIEDRREALRISWYATAGSFEHDRTGRPEADPATTTENVWTAPVQAGVVHFWFVLRDSRGGLDYAALDLRVE
jgi:hypothetical protein